MVVATCSSAGWWSLWDLDERKRSELRGRAAGAAGHVRFTPAIATLAPPRPLLATAHWSTGGRRGEASVHLWDVFDAAAAGGGGAAMQV